AETRMAGAGPRRGLLSRSRDADGDVAGWVGYSTRRAVMGSTFMARRPGMRAAASAVAIRIKAAERMLTGSVGRTPASMAVSERVSSRLTGSPIAMPSRARRAALLRTPARI